MRPLNFGSTITVRLPEETRSLIEVAADREDTSASAWVRKALRAAAASDRLPAASPIAPAQREAA